MPKYTDDGRWEIALDADPAPSSYIPRWLCLICGVRLYQEWVHIHSEWHRRNNDTTPID